MYNAVAAAVFVVVVVVVAAAVRHWKKGGLWQNPNMGFCFLSFFLLWPDT
jgi:hypothetical protein